MKNLINLVIALTALSIGTTLTACKRQCYGCWSDCCKIMSTGSYVCANSYSSFQEYYDVLDSLKPDISCTDKDRRSNYYKEVCNEEDRDTEVLKQGVSCTPIK